MDFLFYRFWKKSAVYLSRLRSAADNYWANRSRPEFQPMDQHPVLPGHCSRPGWVIALCNFLYADLLVGWLYT